MPLNIWNKVQSIGPPFKTFGTMEITEEKQSTLATIVHASLMFGRLPETRMRKAPIAGHKTAKNGL
jgi:hypothetical protein